MGAGAYLTTVIARQGTYTTLDISRLHPEHRVVACFNCIGDRVWLPGTPRTHFAHLIDPYRDTVMLLLDIAAAYAGEKCLSPAAAEAFGLPDPDFLPLIEPVGTPEVRDPVTGRVTQPSVVRGFRLFLLARGPLPPELAEQFNQACAGPRGRKRAREGGDDDLEERARQRRRRRRQGDEENSNGGGEAQPPGDIRVVFDGFQPPPPPPPRAPQRPPRDVLAETWFGVGVRTHLALANYVRTRLQTMPKTDFLRLHGSKAHRGTLPPEYRFLQYSNCLTLSATMLRSIVSPWSDANRGDGERSLDEMLVSPDENQHREMWARRLFLAGDMFVDGLQDGAEAGRRAAADGIDLEYFRVSNYYANYPDTIEPPTADTSATTFIGLSTERWRTYLRQLRASAPALFQPGAPAPQNFHRPWTVSVIRPENTSPELFVRMPLPYAYGQPLTQGGEDIGAPLVIANPHIRLLAAAALTERGDNNTIGHVLVPAIDNSAQRATLAPQIHGREQRRLDAARRLLGLPNIDAHLRGFLFARTSYVRTVFAEERTSYRSLSYPRLLTAPPESHIPLEAHRQEMARIVSEFSNNHHPPQQPEVAAAAAASAPEPSSAAAEGPRVEREAPSEVRTVERLVMVERDIDQVEQPVNINHADTIRIDARQYGIAIDYVDNSDGLADAVGRDLQGLPPNLTEDELLQRAMLLKRHCPDVASQPNGLLKLSSIMCLRVVNAARWAAFEREFDGRSQEEYNEAKREMVRRSVNETLDYWQTIQRESNAFRQKRDAIIQLVTSSGGCTIPLQPSINGSSFHGFISLIMFGMQTYGEIAPRTFWPAFIVYMACLSAAYRPPLTSGHPKPNIFMEGDGGIGKSFILELVSALLLPGSVMQASHLSKHALNSGGNVSDCVLMEAEMQTGHMVNPAEKPQRGGGGRNYNDAAYDSERVNMFKTALTEHVLTALVTVLNSDTKERHPEYVQSLCYFMMVAATNTELNQQAADSMLRRFITLRMHGSTQKGKHEAATSMFRPESVASNPGFEELRRILQVIQSGVEMLAFLINTHALPDSGDVITEPVRVLGEHICNSLINDFHVDQKHLTISRRTMIMDMARTICLARVFYQLVGTPEGHYYLGERNLTALSREAVIDFLLPRLFVTPQDYILAFSMVAYSFSNRDEEFIALILAHMGEAEKGSNLPIMPLRVHPYEVPGEDRLKHRNVEARRAVNLLPPPDAPTSTTASTELVGSTARAARDVHVKEYDPQAILSDYRYIVVPFVGDIDDVFTKVNEFMVNTMPFVIRKAQVMSTVYGWRGRRVKSPYYDYDPVTQKLIVYKDEKNQVPMDSIPVVVIRAEPTDMSGSYMGRHSSSNKQKQKQLGIARAFLSMFFGYCSTDHEKEERKKEYMMHACPSASEMEVFERKLDLSLDERLQMLTAKPGEINEAWARSLAYADGMRPIHGAFRSVLTNALLNQRGTLEDRKARLEERERNQLAPVCFLIAESPPSVEIDTGDVGVGDRPIVVNGLLPRLLEVRADPMPTKPLVLVNTSRPSPVAGMEMAAALWRPLGEALKAPIMAYCKTTKFVLEADPEFIAARDRWESLGQPIPFFYQMLCAQMGIELPPKNLWTWRPMVEKIDKIIRERTDPSEPLKNVLRKTIRWPEQDILAAANAITDTEKDRQGTRSIGSISAHRRRQPDAPLASQPSPPPPPPALPPQPSSPSHSPPPPPSVLMMRDLLPPPPPPPARLQQQQQQVEDSMDLDQDFAPAPEPRTEPRRERRVLTFPHSSQ